MALILYLYEIKNKDSPKGDGPYLMKKPHFGDVMKLRVNKF